MAHGASAPPSSSGVGSSSGTTRRRRPERRVMDVRVWYTLESSPHRMLAPLGRPTSIELLPPMRRSTSSTGEAGCATGSATLRFAKVTLKTCLSAICISSPELILDRKRDFILYVIDPEETYKANKRQRTQRASALHSPGVASTSRDRDSSKDTNPIFVGRGFFGWVLEEEGDGDTVVIGKVTSERSDRSWDNNDSDQEEDEEDVVEYLDVEIRMKETQAQSREQYFNMLKQFGGSTSSTPTAPSTSAAPKSARQVEASSSPQQQRPRKRSQGGQGCSSPAHSAPHQHPQRSSSPLPPPSSGGLQGPLTSTGQQAQAMQLLALVQALQARQAQNQIGGVSHLELPNPTSNEPQSEAATRLQRMLGPSTGLTRSASQPQMAHEKMLTPSLPRTYSAANIPATADVASSDDQSALSGGASKGEATYQCYNCGAEDKIKAVWRIVTLGKGTRVSFPRSFESNHGKDAIPVEDRQKLEVESNGFVAANGRSLWRACNRCGLFWQKWKQSRPDKLEKRRMVPKRRSREGATGESDVGDEDERDEIDHSSPGPGRETPQSQPPKKRIRHRPTLEEQELVMDNFGQWRSKRSIRENPEGKKPGRPKGCKTGAGKGKSRDARNRERPSSHTVMPVSEPGDEPSSRQSRRLSSIAQTSPLRSTGDRVFPWDSVGAAAQTSKSTTDSNIGNSSPGISPARRRYGAPAHILQSSPTSALDALLDRDFHNFDFNDPKQVLSFVNSFPSLNGGAEAPRRSPRKNPTGTREDKNPYASTSGSPKSKSKPSANSATFNALVVNETTGSSAAPLLDLDVFSAFTNSKSPISTMKAPGRKPTASKAFMASSPSSRLGEDSEARSGVNGSSALTSLTSPGSPSPSRNRVEDRLKRGRSHLLKSNSTSSLLFPSSPTTRSQSGKTPGRMYPEEEDEEEEEEEEEEEDGPGGDSPTMARKRRMSSTQVCPASPSLGQKKKRDAAVAATLGSATSLPRFNVTSADVSEEMLIKGVSPSPARSPSSRRGPDVFGDTMNRPPPIARASLSPAQGRRLASSPATKHSPLLTALVPHRKPLPATVEDAPSSSAGSSPGDDVSVLSPYDHGTVESYLDMLEDPYGLLQASNFGIAGGAGGSIEIQGNGSMSLDHFAGGIQLHEKLEFGQHLRDFTEEGSRGVAAYALPGVALNEETGGGERLSGGIVGTAGNSIAGTPFDAPDPSSEGQTPILEPRSPNTLLTPRKRGISSPKSSPQSRAAPTTPGKTRSSPRFCNDAKKRDRNSDTNHTTSRPTPAGPPQTPRLASAAGDLSHYLKLPRTPSSKIGSGINPTSLALASAIARSPALQRVLDATSPGAMGAGLGGWDLSAILNANGSFSPLFATPGLPARGGNSSGSSRRSGLSLGLDAGSGASHNANPNAFPDLTPLSPSLSRLLNGFATGGSEGSGDYGDGVAAGSLIQSQRSQLQGQPSADLSTSIGDPSAQVTHAGVVSAKGGLEEIDEQVRQEAYLDFQAMMQDPAFRELWDNASAATSADVDIGGNGLGQVTNF